MQRSIRELQQAMRWTITYHDRYPKFDSITEFMNKALLPLGLLVGILMFGLASCSSSITCVNGTNFSVKWLEYSGLIQVVALWSLVRRVARTTRLGEASIPSTKTFKVKARLRNDRKGEAGRNAEGDYTHEPSGSR